MTIFTAAIEQASDILWNSLLLFLLVGTGVFFTIRLRGVQLRRFGEGFHRVFGNFTLRGKKADDQGMSSFQALATAIAAQVGTGNIAGCATAHRSAAARARMFWVWVSRVLRHGDHLRRGRAGPAVIAPRVERQQSPAARRTTSAPAFKGTLWQGAGGRLLGSLLFWRWASWATWYSPTPSVMRSITPLA